MSRMDRVDPQKLVVIEAPVEIDVATAPSFRAQVLEVAADRTVVVDLTAVRFCDSSGLAALIVAREHLGTGGGRLVLRNPTPPVCRLLEIIHLEGVFDIEA